MRIAMVSPPIEISGGMKQKLLLARALISSGHKVDVVTPQAKSLPAYHFAGRSLHPDQAIAGDPYDVAVVTWYQTLSLAEKLAPSLVHFCQGHEGDLPHLHGERENIEALYRRQIPTLAVSPHLAVRLHERYGTHTLVLPPLLDPSFKPRWGRRKPAPEPTILIHGIYESVVKRIDLARRAIDEYRQDSPARVVRISTFPRCAKEPLTDPRDRYFENIPPLAVARLTADADLTLFTSDNGEGFGLPVLESIAAGVPVVAVRIPSLAVFESMNIAEMVGEPEPETLARAVRQVLADSGKWRRMRSRGLAFARLWRKTQYHRAGELFQRLLES